MKTLEEGNSIAEIFRASSGRFNYEPLCGQTDLDRNKHDGRFRPKPAVHSLDQMTHHLADS
jgi:hypothetical protein